MGRTRTEQDQTRPNKGATIAVNPPPFWHHAIVRPPRLFQRARKCCTIHCGDTPRGSCGVDSDRGDLDVRFQDVRKVVGDIPFMQPERAQVLYDHILKQRPSQVIELGIAHGVSSCYIAAALDENQHGHLTGVDLVGASFQPTAEELLATAGLSSYVTICREKSSYTWFLKKRIEER